MTASRDDPPPPSDELVDPDDPGPGDNGPPSSSRLDLRYLTDPRFGPAMVRRRARRAFGLFLLLARRSLAAGLSPVSPAHEELCRACGLDPAAPHSRPALSRLLRDLRTEYGVIDYDPVRRRRPMITLVPPAADADPLQPRHYVRLDGLWDASMRSRFDRLGPAAFAAEYMALVAAYESDLARAKHGRAYWFYPLERVAQTFRVSVGFAGAGLRGLVGLGVLRVAHGQFGLTPKADEFGRANRYYYDGFASLPARDDALRRLEREYEAEFPLALSWSAALTNGATAKNVGGLCGLARRQGAEAVAAAIDRLATLPRRSLKRRLAYLAAVLEPKAGEDSATTETPPPACGPADAAAEY